jgi:hypothetical protein
MDVYGGFQTWGDPQNRWIIMEIPIEMFDLEFRGTTILGKKPTYQKIQIDIALYSFI